MSDTTTTERRGDEIKGIHASTVLCERCCWGDRCDDPSHFYRPECPFCFGTGRVAMERLAAYEAAAARAVQPKGARASAGEQENPR
jgi:hypothetical protein